MKYNSEKSIERGVVYLASQQRLDGSFLSYSSPSQNNFEEAQEYETVFTSALILTALHHINTPKTQTIKSKIVRFLLTQKSEHWTFNYWNRLSKEYTSLPYPDDLDDTFCALSALHLYDKSIINGNALASIVHILTSLETQEGGPYRTWITENTADDIWKDVDLAVNANIAYFLILNKIHLPNLETFIEDAITENRFTSPYYPTPYPILYFISRWYTGEYKEKAIEYILSKRKKDRWGNPVNDACAVSALLRFGYDPSQLTLDVEQISQTLSQPSSFTFYTGINPKRDTRFYAGSPSLTTALILEMMLLHQDYLKLTQQSQPKQNKAKELHINTMNFIDNRLESTSPNIQAMFKTFSSKLRKTDDDVKIILLPYLFYTSLNHEKTKKTKLPKDFFIKLGAANLYGWIAYTIYDDFLDDEGSPQTLPTANVCLRELTNIFESILPNTHFPHTFHSIMDAIDGANAWEVANCRFTNSTQTGDQPLPNFKNFQQLANKSLGHALGPLAVLTALGYEPENIDYQKTLNFFTHYLIARQLNDDAHDWEHDFNKGQLNAVSTILLREAHIDDLYSVDLEKLNELFWDKVVLDIATIMLDHIKSARESIQSVKLIHDFTLFENLLKPIEQSAHKVISEQKKATEFIAAYKA